MTDRSIPAIFFQGTRSLSSTAVCQAHILKRQLRTKATSAQKRCKNERNAETISTTYFTSFIIKAEIMGCEKTNKQMEQNINIKMDPSYMGIQNLIKVPQQIIGRKYGLLTNNDKKIRSLSGKKFSWLHMSQRTQNKFQMKQRFKYLKNETTWH